MIYYDLRFVAKTIMTLRIQVILELFISKVNNLVCFSYQMNLLYDIFLNKPLYYNKYGF